MENTRRSIRGAATLATAGALALMPIAVAPPGLQTPDISPIHISAQAIQLTDAWSDLFTETATNVTELVKLFVGAESGVPLPNPTIFLAPVATQLVLNQLIYLGQVFSGQGSQIPGEISAHLTKVVDLFGQVGALLPDLITLQIRTPFVALQQALTSISTASNPLIGLLEAPAVFLNVALNTSFGLLGVEGPIGFPITVRNVLATSIDPPLPGWLSHILQPGKVPGAAALTPKTTGTLKSTVGASSARSKPKSAHSSSHKASANASTSHGSVGHGKRN